MTPVRAYTLLPGQHTAHPTLDILLHCIPQHVRYDIATSVGRKGQITIEREIREALGIAAGWRAVQRVDDGSLVIRFLPPKHRRSLAGVLREATSVRAALGAELHRAIVDAWHRTGDEGEPDAAAEDNRDRG